MQRLRNRAACLCCARCGAFAGSDALVQCAAPSIPRDGASLADALKELNIKHRSHGVVFCGCGAVYCSEACLDDDDEIRVNVASGDDEVLVNVELESISARYSLHLSPVC